MEGRTPSQLSGFLLCICLLLALPGCGPILADSSVRNAKALLNEVKPLKDAQKYDEALSRAQAWLVRAQRKSPVDEKLQCLALQSMADTYQLSGEQNLAKSKLLEALPICERAFGENNINTGSLLHSLGAIYMAEGNAPVAKRTLERSRTIALNRPGGKTHPDTAMVSNVLGLLYSSLGEYAKAEDEFKRGVAIARASMQLGPDNSATATILHNAAINYQRWAETPFEREKRPERYARALSLYQESLRITEKGTSDPEHSLPVATSRLSLGICYHAIGQYAQAERLYLSALGTRKSVLGPTNSLTRGVLKQLGLLEHERGHPALAKVYYVRALPPRDGADVDSVDTVQLLRNLSALEEEQGLLSEAVEHSRRAGRALDLPLAAQLYVGTEAQKRGRMESSIPYAYLDVALSLHAQEHSVEGAGSLGIEAIWSYKGRVLDNLADTYALVRKQLHPERPRTLDQLRRVNAELALQTQPPELSDAQFQARLAELRATSDKLESELSDQSAIFANTYSRYNIGMVQRALPAGAALIELFQYRPPLGQGFDEPHYAAYVLTREGVPIGIDLGLASDLEGVAFTDLQSSLRTPGATVVDKAARALDERLMRPIRAKLGGVNWLFIAPDGVLNLVPFEALIDEGGQYLIKRYAFTYLTSGRDLVRLGGNVASRSGPIVVADPDLMACGPAECGVAACSIKDSAVPRGSFCQLKGAAAEAVALQKILDLDASGMYLGPRADKSAIVQIRAPSVLHFATHGYFEPSESDAPPRIGPKSEQDNPLLRSGLVLAGANQAGAAGQHGLLTALEVTTLDLKGTRLVVMSACETGLGDVQSGEGVYGLRRAFAIAGAQTQVMTLWRVDDDAAKDLMVDYYARLKAGAGRSEGLQAAKLAMLRDTAKPYRNHPYYWASYVVVGNGDPMR